MSDPFSNPFRGDVDRMPTASIPAPTQPVQSRPLPPTTGTRPLAYAPSYSAPSHAAYPAERATNIAGWTAEGGMPIVMAQGETPEVIARRYGIPTAALLKTNGFASSAEVRPGARLIIPTYNAALAASSGMRFAGREPEHRHERLKWVRGPEPANKRLARSEKFEREHAEKYARLEQRKEEKRAKLVRPEPIKPMAHIVTPNTTVAQAAPVTRKPIDPMATASLEDGKTVAPEFRWPAHGRIIQCYRCGGNDGINIALPEGTSVRAAEAGVVAYAGSDLKGYGNLILIRHPDGFVTAYANNSEIEVKRGDVVKRGQVIAKSGQSGNVASPQLHFELRKGSTPVDPTQYLAGL
ncbi:MAG TPA: M23 family metallopeptidase [Methylovirgula sp.]|nr:M23 family metallopeptidase [Methylovirgula sp.]